MHCEFTKHRTHTMWCTHLLSLSWLGGSWQPELKSWRGLLFRVVLQAAVRLFVSRHVSTPQLKTCIQVWLRWRNWGIEEKKTGHCTIETCTWEQKSTLWSDDDCNLETNVNAVLPSHFPPGLLQFEVRLELFYVMKLHLPLQQQLSGESVPQPNF